MATGLRSLAERALLARSYTPTTVLEHALPFGDEQGYGSTAPAWVRTVIGGWSVSGIYTYQSGAVLTWGNVIYLGGDLQWDPRNVDRAFNTAATSSDFGRVTSQANAPRSVQFAVRLIW